MHFKQIPLARVGIRGPKKTKTNQAQPKLASKNNEHENEWAQKVRSFVFWCPRESIMLSVQTAHMIEWTHFGAWGHFALHSIEAFARL